jgi:hypothetical protein
MCVGRFRYIEWKITAVRHELLKHVRAAEQFDTERVLITFTFNTVVLVGFFFFFFFLRDRIFRHKLSGPTREFCDAHRVKTEQKYSSFVRKQY